MLGLSLSGAAWAHPDHDEPAFEKKPLPNRFTLQLASKDGIATVYVWNRGQGFPAAGFTGTLSVPAGAGKTEVALQPAGNNAMTTKEKVKLAPGTKATVTVTLLDRIKLTEELIVP